MAVVSDAEFIGDEGALHADRLRTVLSPQLTMVADAWSQVGVALTVFAAELEDCQGELGRLAALAAADQAVLDQGPWMTTQRTRPASDRTPEPALMEAQRGLEALQERAIAVRWRHDQAQRACCRVIDRAASLAPAPGPGTSTGAARPAVAAGAEPSRLTMLAAGLKIAAGTSTGYADRLGSALRGGHTFASIPSDGPSGGGSAGADPVDPIAGSPADLHRRIVAACSYEQGTTAFGNTDPDIEMYCTAIADSAVADPAIMTQVLEKWPMAGYPASPLPGGWAAIGEGFAMAGSLFADLAGVGDCFGGPVDDCIAGVAMMLVPGGRVAKVSKEAIEASKAASRAAREARLKAAADARAAAKAAKGTSHRLAVGYQREVRVAELTHGRVMSTEPGRPGTLIKGKSGRETDVDVIGGDGSYIAVGGPAKARSLKDTIENLEVLKEVADEAGVPARAYFEKGSPQILLDEAAKVLGADHVHVFS